MSIKDLSVTVIRGGDTTGESKKSEWRYGVWCLGVKKRARSRNKHTQLNIGRGSTLDREIAEAAARGWIAKNMKTVERAEVIAHRMDIVTERDGVVIEGWSPFDEESNKRWPIDVASLVG